MPHCTPLAALLQGIQNVMDLDSLNLVIPLYGGFVFDLSQFYFTNNSANNRFGAINK